MARRKLASRLAMYRGKVSIDIVSISVVAGQNVDTTIHSALQVLYNEVSEVVIDGDLSQQALQTFIFRVYDNTLIIDTGDIVVFEGARFEIKSTDKRQTPQNEIIISATKLESS